MIPRPIRDSAEIAARPAEQEGVRVNRGEAANDSEEASYSQGANTRWTNLKLTFR